MFETNLAKDKISLVIEEKVDLQNGYNTWMDQLKKTIRQVETTKRKIHERILRDCLE